MRKMKDSGIEWIGDIPSEWDIKTAFQLFTQVKNKNEGLIEKNLLSLSYGKIKRKDIDTIGGLLPESFESYNIIEENDIVLRLTDLQNDHTSLRVGFSNERGIVTSAYVTLRNRSNDTPRYLYYYLHTFDVAKGFYGMGAGVRQGLNWDGLKKLKIVVPPVSEQKKITSFLDRTCAEIDTIIEKTKATIEEYKKLKQSVITEAVTKGIRGDRAMKDSGIEWIGDIPAEWNKDKVVRLFQKIGSGTTPKSTDDENFNGDINWLQSGDINGSIITQSKNHISQDVINTYSALKIYKSPFIIIAMYGASIGNVSISQIDACVNQACCVLSDSQLNFHYAFYAFRASQKYLMHKGIGGGQPNISQDVIKQLWLPVPDLSEQEEIANYLDKKCDEFDKLIADKTHLLEEMENYKKSVIYEYVTGKKQVFV